MSYYTKTKIKMKLKHFIIYICCVALYACTTKAVDNSQSAGHGHSHGGGNEHNHGEVPTVDHTILTKYTELFVEFPALVKGKTSRFTSHFTLLYKHQPVRKGSVTVSLLKGTKVVQKHTVNQPARAGIFTPKITPEKPGMYHLKFELKTQKLTDEILIRNVRVFSTVAKAVHTIPAPHPGDEVTFLKEQAWKINFQTIKAEKADVYDVINTSGVWRDASGASKSLAAKVHGIVEFANRNLTEGMVVQQGQLLMNISSKGLTSNNLRSDIEQAKVTYQQAKAAFERNKKLYEAKVVPKATLEKIESNYLVAKSAYDNLKAGYALGGKQVYAPFSGHIKSIEVDNGDFVKEGKALMSIVAEHSQVLEVQLSPSHAHLTKAIKDVWYESNQKGWRNIRATGGSILSIGKKVSRNQPMLSLYVQINEPVQAPDGGFTEVQLMMGQSYKLGSVAEENDEEKKGLRIPQSALLEDYGSYSVAVQLSGESYEIKPVRIGRRNGKWVEVLTGLKEGEVVVSTGAYQIKMASMSGEAPAHGHAH